MFHRTLMIIGVTLILALGPLGLGVAPSGATSGTHCTFSSAAPVDLNPGISYTPSSGTFVEPGSGTVECKGALNGTGTTNPDSGTYRDATCQNGGTGESDPSFTIGSQTLTDHVRITFGRQPSTNGKGIIRAEFEGQKFKGTLDITPTKGDCIINPITQITGAGEFTLK